MTNISSKPMTRADIALMLQSIGDMQATLMHAIERDMHDRELTAHVRAALEASREAIEHLRYLSVFG
jgi:hypothetical protein